MLAAMKVGDEGRPCFKTDLVKALRGRFSANTIHKYMKDLIDEGSFIVDLYLTSKTSPRVCYRVTAKGIDVAYRDQIKMDFGVAIDEMTPEQLRIRVRQLQKIITTNTEVFERQFEEWRQKGYVRKAKG